MTQKSKALKLRIKDTLVLYLKTQFVVIVVVTLIAWAVLSYLNIRYSLLLACITGSLAVIPMFGLITGAVITAVVATFDNVRFIANVPEGVEGLAVFGIYILLNFAIDWGLTPFLSAKIVKINPFILFVVVFLGSAVFGLFGTLLAVPLLLVAKTVWEYYN